MKRILSAALLFTLISTVACAPISPDFVESAAAPAAAAMPTSVPYVQEEVHLDVGATGTQIQDTLAANSGIGYLLDAEAGQSMSVSLQSSGSVVQFIVMTYPDGQVLEPLSDPSPTWSGILPFTGTYLINLLNSSAAAAAYDLTIEFSPLPAPAPTAAPAPSQSATRIQFSPGAVSATVNGTAGQYAAALYVVEASGGQTMNVYTAPAGYVGISVYGADGTVLQSPMGGLGSFSGVLPSTQDWYISVSTQIGADADFQMTVNIE